MELENKSISIILVSSAQVLGLKYVADRMGSLSSSIHDAMLFLDEGVAEKVAGRVEALYETRGIIVSCVVERVELNQLKCAAPTAIFQQK